MPRPVDQSLHDAEGEVVRGAVAIEHRRGHGGERRASGIVPRPSRDDATRLPSSPMPLELPHELRTVFTSLLEGSLVPGVPSRRAASSRARNRARPCRTRGSSQPPCSSRSRSDVHLDRRQLHRMARRAPVPLRSVSDVAPMVRRVRPRSSRGVPLPAHGEDDAPRTYGVGNPLQSILALSCRAMPSQFHPEYPSPRSAGDHPEVGRNAVVLTDPWVGRGRHVIRRGATTEPEEVFRVGAQYAAVSPATSHVVGLLIIDA